jgi:hypothetical protein
VKTNELDIHTNKVAQLIEKHSIANSAGGGVEFLYEDHR